MIILHHEELIFLKPRKVAGTSFEIALSTFADKSSVITPIDARDEEIRSHLTGFKPQNFKFTPRDYVLGFRSWKSLVNRHDRMKFWNHIDAKNVKLRVGEDVWNQYRKISVIRNPFDVMVSMYFWRVDEHHRSSISFEQFVECRRDRIPLNKQLYEIDGEGVVDFMIRYEDFDADLERLEGLVPGLRGLASTFRGIRAKGHTRPASVRTVDMYEEAPRARALIGELWHKEIMQYGFETP